MNGTSGFQEVRSSSSGHQQIGYCTNNGIDSEQVPGTFSVHTISSPSPRISAQSEQWFLTPFLSPLSYLLSALFCVVLPLVSLGQEPKTAPQELVDLLGTTPPGAEKSSRLPEKAEGLNISSKIAQKFYERTIAGSRFREGKLDWDLLIQLIKGKPSVPIALKLLEEVVIEFTPEEYKPLNSKGSAGGQKRRWFGRVTQKGKVVGEGLFIIDETMQKITATIQYNDKLYEIFSLKNGNVRILEIKPGRFPGDHHKPMPAEPPPNLRRPAQPPPHLAQIKCPAPHYVIDLLILYTEDAQKTAQATGKEISSKFFDAVQITNKAFEASKIKAEVRIVGTKLIPTNLLAEDYDLSFALDKLQDSLHLGNRVATWRKDAGADLVSLWVSSGKGCGAANYFTHRDPRPKGEDGFSVVVESCPDSLAHEIGHNLGALHTRWDEKVGNNPNTFNFGYLSVPDGLRTIEAYNEQCIAEGKDCRRVWHYSNPDIPFPGVVTKTGISVNTPGAADNHTKLNTIVCEAAAYRSPP
jgi:hypothetical protein